MDASQRKELIRDFIQVGNMGWAGAYVTGDRREVHQKCNVTRFGSSRVRYKQRVIPVKENDMTKLDYAIEELRLDVTRLRINVANKPAQHVLVLSEIVLAEESLQRVKALAYADLHIENEKRALAEIDAAT